MQDEPLEIYADTHRNALADWIMLQQKASASSELAKAEKTLKRIAGTMEEAVQLAAATKATTLADLKIKARMILVDASSAAGPRPSLDRLVVSLCHDLDTLPN